MFVSLRQRFSKAPTVAALVLLLAACGGDKVSDSTPPETPPPAPAAAATTAPAASTPLPGMSCNLPAVSRTADNCNREGDGVFISQVDAAISKLMREQPQIFDGNVIKELGSFRVGVLKNLEATGLCVQWDEDRTGHRELMVKNSNAFSEQYHIELSNGQVRMGLGAYRSTCYPANFPVNPQPLPQRGDCKLASSREYGCARDGSPKFVGLMDEVVAEVSRERTDLVQNGYLVASWDAYHDAVIQKLRARGYCAFFDVEEIAIKNTNDFSEQYKMEYSWGQQRKGQDSWRSTCRPASF